MNMPISTGAAGLRCGVAYIQECPGTGRRSAGSLNRASPEGEKDLQYKTLGNTGVIVSRICLGTMTFGSGRGGFKTFGTADQSQADELVKGAYARGVNFFDTADIYAEGESEKILGKSFKNLNIPRNEVAGKSHVLRIEPGCLANAHE